MSARLLLAAALTTLLSHPSLAEDISGTTQTHNHSIDSLNETQHDNIHVPACGSKGIFGLLERLQKIEKELCQKKIDFAQLQEAMNYMNVAKAVETQNWNLRLEVLRLNVTSSCDRWSHAVVMKHEREKNEVSQRYEREISELKTKLAQVESQQTSDFKRRCTDKEKNLDMVELESGKYFFSGDLTMNWFNAMKFCSSYGLELLSIEHSRELELIIKKTEEIGMQHLGYYWTSGSDLAEEGRWSWASTGRDISFSGWHPHQPDNWQGSQNCAALWNLNGSVQWDDKLCSSIGKFICERKEVCHDIDA